MYIRMCVNVTLIIVVVACVLLSRYQPVWMTDMSVASNVIMSTISSPYLFVLNPQTHEFYLVDESTALHPTIDAVADFLDDISNGSRQVASLLAAASTVHITYLFSYCNRSIFVTTMNQ